MAFNNIIIKEKITNSFLRLVGVIVELHIYILWKLKLYVAISALFAILIMIYNNMHIKNNDGEKKFILALNRSIFSDDVKALRKYPSDYTILIYPVKFRILLSDETVNLFPLWPSELTKQTSFYSKKDDHKDFFKRISRVFSYILTILSFFEIEVKVIMTANFDYYQDYPWISAIHKNNGKFVVLEKESIFYLPFSVENLMSWHKKHGFRFEGDAIFFYNKNAKNIYLNCGVVKPNQCYVTGSPRVDSLIELSAKKEGNLILLASFMKKGYKSLGLWNEIINIIYNDKELRKNTIVKCRDHDGVKNINKNFPGMTTVYGSMKEYLKKPIAIFTSFNSTTCLDALITGIPVVIPAWDAAEEASKNAILGEHTSDLIYVAKDKKSFITILKQHIHKKENCNRYNLIDKNEKLRRIVEENYSPLDGKNCQRVFECIDDLL